MKTKKIAKKLALNKETVYNLSVGDMVQARGGVSLLPDVCKTTDTNPDTIGCLNSLPTDTNPLTDINCYLSVTGCF